MCSCASIILFVLSDKLGHSRSAGHRRPLPKSGKKKWRWEIEPQRLVPHLGVQGRSSGSSCWVREGCVREAWSQLSGVQRVRSPGIRRCWDQCCPCQIIWGSTGKHTADRASTSGQNAQTKAAVSLLTPGCVTVCLKGLLPTTKLMELTYHLYHHVGFIEERHQAALRSDFFCRGSEATLPPLESITSRKETWALGSRAWKHDVPKEMHLLQS